MSDVQKLISELQHSITETLEKLEGLTGTHLDHECEHGCAMGDGVRGLLMHNIDHERMHLGQVHDTRFRQKAMQRDYASRLMAEWASVNGPSLPAALVGLSDEDIDVRLEEDEWTIRETIEHTLYWERNSVDHLVGEHELA